MATFDIRPTRPRERKHFSRALGALVVDDALRERFAAAPSDCAARQGWELTDWELRVLSELLASTQRS